MSIIAPGIPFLPTFTDKGTVDTLKNIKWQLAIALIRSAVEHWMITPKGAQVRKVIFTQAKKIIEAFFLRENVNDEAFRIKDADWSGEAHPAKWGSLGDIDFDILSSPSGFSIDEGMNYTQHAIIGGKPHVQFTGQKLRRITLDIAWHAMAMNDIEKSLEDLRTAMNTRQILSLVIGDTKIGSYRSGDFVIEDMPQSIEKYHFDGSLMSLELTIKLLEWNTGKPLEPGQHDPPKAVITPGKPKPPETKNDDGIVVEEDMTTSQSTATAIAVSNANQGDVRSSMLMALSGIGK